VNQPVACREVETGLIPLFSQVKLYPHLLDLINLGLQPVYVIFLVLQDGFKEFATSVSDLVLSTDKGSRGLTRPSACTACFRVSGFLSFNESSRKRRARSRLVAAIT
jgi:hypothetical protein